ncbi:MAG: hypothetical protein OXH10_07715 [bacterium]|nr:hypothetical protein [bacterium]MCY3580552.1 hypothetical protein [bacterium]MCY3651810.1 hypothetical protein [bacterium]MXX64589.1 hypothetical protein [Acidimicrobiia bacterium]
MPAETIQIRNPSDDATTAAGMIPAPHNARKALEETLYELSLDVLQWAESPGQIAIGQIGTLPSSSDLYDRAAEWPA